MSLITLSVVVVNYNTHDDLRACLDALHECRPRPEIIVVDNDSRDGSAEMVRREFPRVVLLLPQRNLWFCGGNNLGVAVAHSEYVLLLNPDTIPPPGALGSMVDFIRANPDYAGVTMQLRYPNGEIQRTCSRIPTYEYLVLAHTPIGWLRARRRRLVAAHHWYEDEGWARDRDFDVQAVPGSCTLMRREELQLDEKLLLYFPEEDLARRAGGRLFRFLASQAIIHREKSATRSALATRVYFRDLMVYTRKHHGAARAMLLWILTRPLAWGLAVRWRLRRV